MRMWLAALITGHVAKEWKRKRLLTEPCVLSCNLRSDTLICLRRWLRSCLTLNICEGFICQHRSWISVVSLKFKHFTQKGSQTSVDGGTVQTLLTVWRLDELIRLSPVNRPAETFPHAREDKTIDRESLHWDSSWASPSQTARACLRFPWHLMSQPECAFRLLGGGGEEGSSRGGTFEVRTIIRI